MTAYCNQEQVSNFNPRSHKGSDEDGSSLTAVTIGFQSTLPQGERPLSPTDAELEADFNPRSHKGSDPGGICGLYVKIDFNPRSHKGSDYIKLVFSTDIKNFNPRSHKGSDLTLSPPHICSGISIHAPTRGATKKFWLIAWIHRFQSTLPQGERHAGWNACVDKMIISIHAPTRGATSPSYLHSFRLNHFNPRSHKGSDFLQ